MKHRGVSWFPVDKIVDGIYAGRHIGCMVRQRGRRKARPD